MEQAKPAEIMPPGAAYAPHIGAVVTDVKTVRMEMREMEVPQGEIVMLGTLREVLSPNNPEVWKGAISRTKRFQPDGDLYGKEAYVKSIEGQQNAFYVPTTPGAPKRCVDGRSPENALRLPGQRPLLGPQQQGGTTSEAVAYRYVSGVEGATTLAEDLKQRSAVRDSRYADGNHIGNPAKCSPSCTGCGNLDSQEKRASVYADPIVATVVTGGVGAILQADGKQATPGVYERMAQNALSLRELAPDYYAQLDEVVAALRKSNPSAVETLPGTHCELSVLVNLVRETTFDRDGYNHLSGGKIQAFGLDAWNVIDEHPSEVAEAILSDTMTTLMELTDGTLELGIRRPVAVAPAVA